MQAGEGKSLFNDKNVSRGSVVLYSMPRFEKVKTGVPYSETGTALTLDHNSEDFERQAYEKGFQSGEKAGFELGEQKALMLIEKLEGLINGITTLREAIIRETEPVLIQLSVGIARKIILKELDTRPEEILDITREALRKIKRTGRITIKVNPSLYEFFIKHGKALDETHPDIVFDPDPSVSPYGTVIISPVEETITDIDEQLRNIIKDMCDKLAGR